MRVLRRWYGVRGVRNGAHSNQTSSYAGLQRLLSETVKALVVVDSEITEQELIDYCREKLAHYKCPTSIEFRDELARTATGKLQKYKLRAPYWEGQEKQIN